MIRSEPQTTKDQDFQRALQKFEAFRLTVYRRHATYTIMTSKSAVLLILVTVIPGAHAATAPRFEVASVKPIQGELNFNTSLKIEHGKLKADNATLKQLVALAYGTQGARVLGGPTWMGWDLYYIEAKAESPNASREQVQVMLQTLLTERFKLAVDHETRQCRCT